MDIKEAVEEFNFFNEGDYITRDMSIAKDMVLKTLKDTQSDLYEANNIINDSLDIEKQKDEIINEMAEQLAGIAIWDNKKDEPLILASKEEVIEYYEERCK